MHPVISQSPANTHVCCHKDGCVRTSTTGEWPPGPVTRIKAPTTGHTGHNFVPAHPVLYSLVDTSGISLDHSPVNARAFRETWKCGVLNSVHRVRRLTEQSAGWSITATVNQIPLTLDRLEFIALFTGNNVKCVPFVTRTTHCVSLFSVNGSVWPRQCPTCQFGEALYSTIQILDTCFSCFLASVCKYRAFYPACLKSRQIGGYV